MRPEFDYIKHRNVKKNSREVTEVKTEEVTESRLLNKEELASNKEGGYDAGDTVESNGDTIIKTNKIEAPEQKENTKNSVTHLDILNAKLLANKQRQNEIQESAKATRGSFNIDEARRENDELKKEEESLLKQVKRFEEKEREQAILKEQFERREKLFSNLEKIKQRQNEIQESAKATRGSFNIDEARRENDELKKEEESLLKQIGKIEENYPGLNNFISKEEVKEKTETEKEPPEKKPESKEESKDQPEENKPAGFEKIEKELDEKRSNYIREYKKWKKESGKKITNDKANRASFNALVGLSRLMFWKKNKIDYKKAISKESYTTEELKKVKQEYDQAKISLGNLMFNDKKSNLEKNNLKKEEIEKELIKYKAEHILKKIIIDERQKVIEGKADKPTTIEKILKKYNSIKPRWKRVAISTIIFLPISATGAVGASAIAAGGIYVGIANLALLKFSASMAIGAVVARSAKTIDWSKRKSDIKFEKEKYKEEAKAKDQFAKKLGNIDQSQIEDYESSINKIEKERGTRQRNRAISKAIVGGIISLSAGYVAYDAMGNGIKELKIKTPVGTLGNIKIENPDSINDIGEIEDMTVSNQIESESQNINTDANKEEIIKDTVNNESQEKIIKLNGKDISKEEFLEKAGQENRIVREEVDSIYEKTVEKIFPNNRDDHAWDNIKEKDANNIFKLEKDGELNETYKPLAQYLNRIEGNTGLSPEQGETIEEYMNRGLSVAYENGKIAEVDMTQISEEAKEAADKIITTEEILKITGAKDLEINGIKDWDNLIKNYEKAGYEIVPGQLPFDLKMEEIDLKSLKTVEIKNVGETDIAVNIASTEKMNNIMELVKGRKVFDYYLKKPTMGDGVEMIHIRFYK